MCRRILCWLTGLSVVLSCAVLQSETVPRRDVQDVWNEEYQELAGQIGRLKNWNGVPRERLRAEALDPQALTLPDDKDPLDIVVRRTGALLQHFENGGAACGASLLTKFSTRLKQLTASADSTSDAESAQDALLRGVPIAARDRDGESAARLRSHRLSCSSSPETAGLSNRPGPVFRDTAKAEGRSSFATSSHRPQSRNRWPA